MKNSPNYIAWLFIILALIALLNSCSKSPQKEVLYSRTWLHGKPSAWTVDVEGSPVTDHEFVFIDSLTGTVEFKYITVNQ